jgi:endonuclease-3
MIRRSDVVAKALRDISEEELERIRLLAADCIEILERLYGQPEGWNMEPIDILVSTILSQNTSDKNSQRAFQLLKAAYPDYGSLMSATQSEIAGVIRSGGLADMKARRIKESLSIIHCSNGSFSLDFLSCMTAEEAALRLTSLPGVGPKTAAVVLLFGFGMPTMPVDTHVHRLAIRLGLVPDKSNVSRTQRILEAITPKGKYLSFHMNLINHGRAVCRARSPGCPGCALLRLCRFVRASRTRGGNV